MKIIVNQTTPLAIVDEKGSILFEWIPQNEEEEDEKMSMQQGAYSIDELLIKIRDLAKEMYDFRDCINAVREIEIRLDEEDGSFIITSD